MSRYFYGIDYAPKDVKFGLMESAENKIGNPAEQLLALLLSLRPGDR